MKNVNAYLQQFKEKKLKAKEAERKKRKKETVKKLQQVYKKQKEALRQAKKDLTDKLISQRKITPPEPPKWLTEPLANNVGDSLFNEDNLYTFEELVNIEQLYPKEEGRLDWMKFNELVEKGRKEIAETLKHYHI